MIKRGLTDEEIAQLTAAGFTPALATTVAREALTMRWLFLRRGVSGLWAVAAAIVIGIAIFIVSWQVEDIAWLIAVAGSLLSFVQYTPHLEAWSLKDTAPPRFAARTLAIMAVIAQRNPKAETNPQLRKLRTLAEGLDPLAHPHTQLRLLAQALDDESASERAVRKTVASSDGVRATLVFGLVVLAVTVIILTLALGARPF